MGFPQLTDDLLRSFELLARILAISGAIGMGLLTFYKWYGKSK